jgi:hypothetical protein
MHTSFSRIRRLLAIGAVVLIGFSGVMTTYPGHDTSSGGADAPGSAGTTSHRADLAAVAISTDTHPAVRDTPVEFVLDRAEGTLRVNTTAVAVPGCPGCDSHASALHILAATRADTLDADNVAEAQAACDGCNADALSIEIVTSRGASTVMANNHADASTAGCTGCTSNAVAIQVVVVKARRQPSQQTRERLGQLTDTAQRQLRAAPAQRGLAPRQQGSDLAQKIADTLTADIGGVSQQHVSADTK